MKRNLGNFTRGSQLLGHFGFMFAAGLRGPLIVALVVLVTILCSTLSARLGDHDQYLVWMRLYALGYRFMEFDPAKNVALEMADGGHLQLPISTLVDLPPVVLAWAKFLNALRAAVFATLVILAPLFVLFYWFAERFGGHSKERKHERGAMLVTYDALARELEDHNTRERRRELRDMLGWRGRFVRARDLEAAGFYTSAKLADLPYPWRLEASHAMLIGTTGTGKTVALRDLIAEARARRQRIVVFDLTGAFIEAFYNPATDIILNPLDARCPQWSVFDDCRDEAEFSAAAEALVPHDGGGTEQFWVLAARMLFVEMCLRLQRDGKATNAALASELMTADLAQVHRMMRGTVADPLTAPEAARMAESIRAVFNANAKALKLLPVTGPHFSVRDWVQSDVRDGSILFLSARYIDMSIASQLLTVWMDTAMNTLMAMERSRDLRMWFLLDELGALHRLPALEKGLQTARNFGGAIVTGIHAYAKLKEIYGENMAMTLSSLARTKLILATADRETATWCSDFIGHRQIRDMEEGFSYGYNNARDAVSLTPRRQIEPLLLPDQLMNLPRLSGYIKFPDGFPAAPVRLRYRDFPKRAEAFIRRVTERPERPGTLVPDNEQTIRSGDTEATGSPPPSDDGAGRPVTPKRRADRALEREGPTRNEPVSRRAIAEGEALRSTQQTLPLDPGNANGAVTGRQPEKASGGSGSTEPAAHARSGDARTNAPARNLPQAKTGDQNELGPDRSGARVVPLGAPRQNHLDLLRGGAPEPPLEPGDFDIGL